MDMIKPSRRTVLLSAAAGAGSLGLPWWARAGSPAKKLVYVLAYGGWDVTFAMDPKLGISGVAGPEATPASNHPEDREELADFGDISLCINPYQRPSVTEFFERWSDRCSVVNGIWVGALGHTACEQRILTGRTGPKHPDLGAITGWELGQSRVVPYMDVGGRARTGDLTARSLQLGLRSQLRHILDPEGGPVAPEDCDHGYPLFVPTNGANSAMQQWLDARAGRYTELRSGPANDRQLADYFESTGLARDLRAGSVSTEWMSDPGRSLNFATQVDAALELMTAGTCQSVALDGTMPYPGWDTHRDNTLQHANYESLFGSLIDLVDGLEGAGILDETVVVVTSEMARPPVLNQGGRGKDHWPSTSALLIGGGVPGGRVFGGTNDSLQAQPVDLVSGEVWADGKGLGFDSFVAGLLSFMDVDPEAWLPGVELFGGLHV